MRIKLNLSTFVEFELTEEGVASLKKHGVDMLFSGKVYKMALWEAMNILGPALYLSGDYVTVNGEITLKPSTVQIDKGP